ncbi:Fungal transcriptional regulatory protein, N-terminal [Pleurostoma richardsiae]|uniref:Fungal transcriptional regulatory protein, N-terminal n=1 Tax=Pleurostoma richardsiae TaxID=41990 RepID=A0AA38RW68_9PEZI|nr:Fungal transcriptional regulatory protein, N-terminal [Pleurostoma richardsiae]
MAEANRSLSACLRCRRQKLRCGGPGQVPCQRCRASSSECVFIPPKASRTSGSAAPALSDKLALLEKRLDQIEGRHQVELRGMQKTISQLTARFGLSPTEARSTPAQSILTGAERPPPAQTDGQRDTLAGAIVEDAEWEQLYAFFYENCRHVTGFVDDQLCSQADVLRQHPLLSTVICVVAARAIKPEKYQEYVSHADELIKNTFSGPSPDLTAVQAIMLLTAWTGRNRLWGYVASIAAEIGLNTAALQLGDDAVAHSALLVERARTWFSLCCFDLVSNLNKPFVINRMRDYLPFAKKLLSSPFCRPVDHRICAYIDSFTIAADAKSQIPRSRVQEQPMPQEIVELLASFDQRVDRWFYEINNNIEPLYQTFSSKQDRNRFMVPYAVMKVYVNGFALHGVEQGSDITDPNRLSCIRKAVDGACLLLRTQFESLDFRRRLRYTIDYNGVTTYYSVNFIINALTAAHKYLDHRKAFLSLRQAAQMFEEAGAVEAANEVRREQDRLVLLTQTVLSPEENQGVTSPSGPEEAALFDIPSFLDAATWDEQFPSLSMYILD